MLSTLLAASPSFAPDTVAPEDPTPLLVLLAVGVTALICGFIVIIVRGGSLFGVALFVVGAVAFSAGTAALSFGSQGTPGQRDAAAAAHAEEVSSWLDDEYRIDVSDDAVSELLAGESIAVTYDGTETLIELRRNGQDEISVFQADTRTALEPVGKD